MKTRDLEKLDPTDVALLAALRDDGRMTIQNLAAAVGLAPATASVRVQALRNAGLVRGIHARVNYSALGYPLCAFVLLRVHDTTGERGQLSERFLELPEVEELSWITGDYDVVLKIWAKDTKHLEAVVVRINEIGARSQTMLVLGEPRVQPGIRFEAPPTRFGNQ